MPLVRWLRPIIRSDFDARAIGFCRIAAGLAAIGQGLITWEILHLLHAPNIARARVLSALPDLEPGYVVIYICAWIIASVCFAAGFMTRISGTVLASVIA